MFIANYVIILRIYIVTESLQIISVAHVICLQIETIVKDANFARGFYDKNPGADLGSSSGTLQQVWRAKQARLSGWEGGGWGGAPPTLHAQRKFCKSGCARLKVVASGRKNCTEKTALRIPVSSSVLTLQ